MKKYLLAVALMLPLFAQAEGRTGVVDPIGAVLLRDVGVGRRALAAAGVGAARVLLEPVGELDPAAAQDHGGRRVEIRRRVRIRQPGAEPRFEVPAFGGGAHRSSAV